MVKTIKEVLAGTDWEALARQKVGLLASIGQLEATGHGHNATQLQGILAWIDALQEAAEQQGWPVVWLDTKRGIEIIRQEGVETYEPRAGDKVRFCFSDDEEFVGVAEGSWWNGFDNVGVTPEVRDQIAASWKGRGEGGYDDEDPESNYRQLLAAPVEEDGLVSLANGWATIIVGRAE